MKLNNRERDILTLAAAGKTSKEIAAAVGVAKITIDMHVGAILSKVDPLNCNQAIAKAITNKLEPLNEELRRRARVVRIFPNAASCLRLTRAHCVETHEAWLEDNRYINMDLLREQRKE